MIDRAIPMAADPRTTSATPTAADGIVCPFCAHVRAKDAGGACPKCTMEDTVGTRRSTGERIGPWFVLQRKNPTAPGLRFSVLLTLARRGHVTGKSIVRGPTTGQLWRYASEVKGLSRLFGICFHCKAGISPDAITCPKCKSAQEIPDDPDVFLESQAALPLMRETVEATEQLPGFSESLIDEHLPARTSRRDPTPRPERRTERKPSGAAMGVAREQGGFDNVEDLSRALTLHQPADADPARPGRRTNGRATSEPILSASELANAFQLGGSPPSFGRRAGRGLWKLTKVVAVLAIVLGAAGAAALYLKPEWRAVAEEKGEPYLAQANAWWTQVSNKIAGTSGEDPSKSVAPLDENGRPMVVKVPPATPIKIDGPGAEMATQPAVEEQPEKPADQPPERRPERQPEVATRTPTQPVPSVVDATPEPTVPEPTTKPAEENRQTVKSPPPVVETPKPEAPKVEEPKSEEPKREEPKPPVRELTLDEAIAQATELRNSGLDAEARRDWRAAVVIYEQIGKLPEAAWPSDLRVRLSLARERLKSQTQ